MGQMRILVVDDDRSVRDALRRALTLAGYEVQMAEGGQQALTQVASGVPDAVVLDVGMPDIDGLEVCRRLRRAGNRLPILMLTARDAIADRIDGLDAGADDYLVKPFDVGELKARAARADAAQQRRGRPDALSFAELKLDSARHGVAVNDQFAELTRTEYQLLELLDAQPAARAAARADLRPRLGLRLRARRQRAARLRRLPAAQARGCGRAADDPHDPRRRLRAARAVKLRTRMAAVAGVAVALTVVTLAATTYEATQSTCAARSTRRCASASSRSSTARRAAAASRRDRRRAQRR